MSRSIENLVFEGGGIKGIAYAGALKALETHGVLSNVKRVAGTSTGAIMALLVSLKLTANTIHDIIDSIDTESVKDGWSPLGFITGYGLYKGDYMLNRLKDVIFDSKLGLQREATFADLYKAECLDMNVYATDLNTRRVRRFSYETTPTVIVAEAVRASMSIPLFFQAWRFSNDIPDDHIYIDGGTAYNYPITAFDVDSINWKTLGFHFDNLSAVSTTESMGFGSILKYAKVLFEIVMNSQKTEFNRNSVRRKRSVLIDDLGVDSIDMDITSERKIELFNSGFVCTGDYLKSISTISRKRRWRNSTYRKM